MSCCGGNCGCGSACKCGKGCSGCGIYPDLSFSESTPSKTLIVGFAPEKEQFEGFVVAAGTENGGCKCGANCSCDPCTCK